MSVKHIIIYAHFTYYYYYIVITRATIVGFGMFIVCNIARVNTRKIDFNTFNQQTLWEIQFKD
jgi:hypothetical protein